LKREDNAGALDDFNHLVEMKGPTIPEACALRGLMEYNLKQWDSAVDDLHNAVVLGSTEEGLSCFVWLAQMQNGKASEAEQGLHAYLDSDRGEKAEEWTKSICRFLLGNLPEDEFLKEATTKARRPSAIRGNVSESFYFAGMKRKLAGDNQGAAALFQKCLDVDDDNNFGYISARFEMRELKNPGR